MRKEPQGAAPAGDAAEAAGQHVGQQREAVHQVELLENDADVAAPGLGLRAEAAVGLGLWAEQRDAAGGTAVHALEPADEADEGRLAGARGADEADHLALADLELDVVQHGLPAEGLADARKRDDGHAAGPLEAGLGGCLAESSTGAG